jgi:hypothetical protein
MIPDTKEHAFNLHKYIAPHSAYCFDFFKSCGAFAFLTSTQGVALGYQYFAPTALAVSF